MKENGISKTQKLRLYENILFFCPCLHGLGISKKTMGHDLGYELLNESPGPRDHPRRRRKHRLSANVARWRGLENTTQEMLARKTSYLEKGHIICLWYMAMRLFCEGFQWCCVSLLQIGLQCDGQFVLYRLDISSPAFWYAKISLYFIVWQEWL